MSCACASKPRLRLELLRVEQVHEETFTFEFKSPEPLEWQEGDSSKIYLNVAGNEQGKKFSFASLPSENVVRFTTRIRKERSDYKDVLSNIDVGENVEVSLPSGQFKLRREDRPIVLLSNGVGIAAMRTFIKSYEGDQTGIPSMIQINVDSKSSIYQTEFSEIELRLDMFKSIYVKHRSTFINQLDFEVQNIISNRVEPPLFYVVGSDVFVNDTILHLNAVGIQSEDIITDGHKSGGTCGCSSDAGCGCGANIVMFS